MIRHEFFYIDISPPASRGLEDEFPVLIAGDVDWSCFGVGLFSPSILLWTIDDHRPCRLGSMIALCWCPATVYCITTPGRVKKKLLAWACIHSKNTQNISKPLSERCFHFKAVLNSHLDGWFKLIPSFWPNALGDWGISTATWTPWVTQHARNYSTT